MDLLDLGRAEQMAEVGATGLANAPRFRRIERAGGRPHVGGKYLVGAGNGVRDTHTIARFALAEP